MTPGMNLARFCVSTQPTGLIKVSQTAHTLNVATRAGYARATPAPAGIGRAAAAPRPGAFDESRGGGGPRLSGAVATTPRAHFAGGKLRPNRTQAFFAGCLGVMGMAAVASAEPAVQYRAIDLGPVAFPSSRAVGVGGGQAVGIGEVANANIYSPEFYSQYPTEGTPHALLWNGTTAVDLNPAGFTASGAAATTGTSQVGFGRTPGGKTHALLWHGTAAAVADLHPENYLGSVAVSAAGSRQVGWGTVGYTSGGIEIRHALVWDGTAATAVDIHPGGFTNSVAMATTGTAHVGCGGTSAFPDHALLWTGTLPSAMDLHPTGLPKDSTLKFSRSEALGIGGDQQVGFARYGSDDAESHAVLWTGTAESAVDLSPPGLSSSTHIFSTIAIATNGSQQIGYSEGSGETGPALEHALLWSGTADSMVDLHQYLPPGFGSSAAAGIDAAGNVVGWASPYNTTFGVPNHAILWQLVPEPTGLAPAAPAGLGLLARRRRRAKAA